MKIRYLAKILTISLLLESVPLYTVSGTEMTALGNDILSVSEEIVSEAAVSGTSVSGMSVSDASVSENEDSFAVSGDIPDISEETVDTVSDSNEEAAGGLTQWKKADISKYLIQEGALPEISLPELMDGDTDDMGSFFETVLSAIDSKEIFQEEGIVISGHHPDRQSTDRLLAVLINDHPEFYYISGRYEYTEDETGSTERIRLYYTDDFGGNTQAVIDSQSDFNMRVAGIMDQMDSCWSNEEKALFIHDWLVMNVEYDYTYKKYSAYNAIVDGSCVCNGYSMAYKYLLDRLNIPCDFVLSINMNHAWNMIKIGGRYYFVDCTWDDGKEKTCYYTHFMVSRDQLHKDHTSTDWTVCYHIEDYTHAYWDNRKDVYNKDISSKDHDSYYWSDLTSPLVFDGNRWAYGTPEGYFIHDYADGRDKYVLPAYDWNYSNPIAFYNGMLVVTNNHKQGMLLYDIDNKRTEATYLLSEDEKAIGRITDIYTKGKYTYYELRADSYWKDDTPSETHCINWSDHYSVSVCFIKDSEVIRSVPVTPGSIFPSDQIPSFPDGSGFIGWYDTDGLWNSSSPVVRNMVLKARFMNSGNVSDFRSGADNYLPLSNGQNACMIQGQKYYLDPGIKWKSSNSSILFVKKGNMAAPLKTGVVTVTSEDGSVSCSVNICKASLGTKSFGMYTGSSRKLSVRLSGPEKPDETLIKERWISSDPTVAEVRNGRVFANGAGTAVISVFINGRVLKCKVRVKDAIRQDFSEGVIRLTPLQQGSIRLRTKFSIKKAVWSSNLSMNEVLNAKGSVIAWQDSVARITKNGKITAVGSGTTVITGTDDKGNTAKFTLSVEKPETRNLYMNTGSKKKISLYKVKAADVEWKTDNTGIAYTENGKFRSGDAPGSTAIKGSYDPYSTGHPVNYDFNVFVEKPEWTGDDRLSKTNTSGTEYELAIKPGDICRLNGKGIYQDVLYRSSNCSVAFMDEAGVVFARNKGTTVLTTKINSKTYRIKVRVE